MKTNDEHLIIRIPREIKAAAQLKATKERLSLAALVRKAIMTLLFPSKGGRK